MTVGVAQEIRTADINNNCKNDSLNLDFQFEYQRPKLLIARLLHNFFYALGIKRVSGRKDVAAVIRKYFSRNTNVLYVDSELGEEKLKKLANKCVARNIDLFLSIPQAKELPQRRNAIAWSVKRALDWLAALVILIVLSPVMLLLGAAIAYTSRGSIFFYQWRVGKSGSLFKIIKFRSMISDADQLHHSVMSGQTGLHKCEDDPRVTSIGRWMRKYSLDELPQLFNVLRGDMSLVGPRPWALYDALRISGDGKRRLNSLPGVTGAWQVSARSTMLDIDDVTECDLSYMRKWSLWLDLKILLMTVPKVLSGFGAF